MQDRLSHAVKWSKKRLVTDPNTPCFVYIIECCGYYKAGLALNPTKRIRELQIGNPFKLTLVKSFKYTNKDAASVERRLHSFWRNFHHRGEWFKVPSDIVHIMARFNYLEQFFS